MTKYQFYTTKLASLLWVRPAILSLGAVGWVGLSYFADHFLPAGLKVNIEKSTLVNLFSILASTMLTVAIFSVSAIAAAFSSVATSATPRATAIVMSDARIQGTLAAFLAAFIYAVVSITVLSALDFGSSGRLTLFLGFVFLVGWVLMSFLGWVDRISRLGRLGDTLSRVRDKARLAFSDPEIAGSLGGLSGSACPNDGKSYIVCSDQFGYVQHIDMGSLQELAASLDGRILLEVRPGSFLAAHAPIARVFTTEHPIEQVKNQLRRCLSIGNERSYQTDPRFSLIMLAEMADRALSPAVNDPGTAIAVLTVQMELFYNWVENQNRNASGSPEYDRIFVPEITARDLIFDAFTPIARDGAGVIEVGIRLQKTLQTLINMRHKALSEAAAEYRASALELAEIALPIESQRQVLRHLANRAVPTFS